MGTLNNIVAAIDTSAMAEEVMKRAIALAKQEKAQITVLHSIDIPWFETLFGEVGGEDEIRKKLEEKMEALRGEEDIDYFVNVTRGDSADAIIYESNRLKSDLIIMGAHGKESIKDLFFGSTAHSVVQKSHIPVLIIKTPSTTQYKKILAVTDLSEASAQSILFAKKLFSGSEIKIAYAYAQIDDLAVDFYNLGEMKEAYREKVRAITKQDVENFQKRVGIDKTEIIESVTSVSEVLLETTKKDESNLVLLGAHGVRISDSVLFGSTTSFLMKAAPSDVLVYVPLEK